MATNEKVWWKSKTNLFRAAQLVAGLMMHLAGQDLIKQYPDAVSWLLFASGVITYVLRSLTTGPVTLLSPVKTKWSVWVLVALMAFAPGLAMAQERQYLNVTTLNAGDYHMHISPDGTVTIVPFRLLEIGSTPPPPTDPGGPTDPEPDLSQVARQVRALCERFTLNRAVSGELAAVYTAVSGRTDVPLSTSFEAIRATTEAVLSVRRADGTLTAEQLANFGRFRDALTEEVNLPLSTAGKFTHATFAEIGDGMSAYAGNQAITADKIIRLVMMVLDAIQDGERLTVPKIISILVELLLP